MTPSFTSVINLVGGPARFERKLPATDSNASEANMHNTALSPSAIESAAPATSAPTEGPRNWFAVSSVAESLLLARSRCSASTMLGRIDWAAVSNNVSPTPSAKPTTYNIHSSTASRATIVDSAPIAIARPKLTSVIVRRRSSRSASAPATSENSSHGNRATNDTEANVVGLRVIVSATSGTQIWYVPSARFDIAEAAISRLKLPPNTSESIGPASPRCQRHGSHASDDQTPHASVGQLGVGPTYLALGRISLPMAACSRAWAH